MASYRSSLRKPNRAPLHAARHERAVGVADNGVKVAAGAFGVGFHCGLPAEDAAVVFGSGFRVGSALAGGGVAQQVGANDDTDVLAFEALAGVDAADLVDGFRLHDPAAAVL